MACTSEIRFKKPVSWIVLKKEIAQVLTERFKENFIIEKDKDGIYIGFNQEEWRSPNLTMWPSKMHEGKIKRLEFSDNLFCQEDNGWFACWLSATIATNHDSMIYSESLGESYKSDFHEKYPIYYKWRTRKDGFVSKFIARQLLKQELREMKKTLPNNIYLDYERKV